MPSEISRYWEKNDNDLFMIILSDSYFPILVPQKLCHCEGPSKPVVIPTTTYKDVYVGESSAWRQNHVFCISKNDSEALYTRPSI
jgi:hypothetical protein